MARIRTMFEPIDRDISVFFEDELSPQARSKHLAETARQALRAAQDQNRAALGAVPPHETTVDGASTTNLDRVRPDGKIVFEFQLLLDIFDTIHQELVANSPIGAGDDPRPG